MRKSLFKFNLLLLFFIIFYCGIAQDKSNDMLISPKGDTVYVKSIAISDITSNIEASYIKIKKIKESLKSDAEPANPDSVFRITNRKVDSLNSEVRKRDFISINELNYEIQVWGGYLKQLEAWKSKINEGLKQIENDAFDLSVMHEQWKLTLARAREAGVPSKVLTSVNDLIKQINTVTARLNEKRTELLGRQNKVTEMKVTVDEVGAFLKATTKTFQSGYFRTNAYPIWHVADTSLGFKYTKKLIVDSYSVNSRHLNDFYKSNRMELIVHLFLFLILWVAFYYLSINAKKILADETFPEMDRAEHVLSMHTLSAMIISLFISIWIYSSLPFIVFNFIQLLYIVIALFFLTRYIDKKIKNVLLGLLVLFFVNEFQVFLFGKSLIARILIIAENAIATWVLYMIISPKYFVAELLKSRRWGIFLKLIPIFFIFIGISFIGNVFGYVNLSLLLNKTVVYALLNLNLLLLVIIVLQKSFSILFRTSFFRKSNIIRENLGYIEKRFFQTIQILGVLLWLRSVLRTLGIYEDLYVWFTEAAQKSWQIGNSTIAIGGIINFFLVIIITSLLVRFLKTLLNEELYPRIRLPRGVPGAISMLVGYVIVAYGFFIALGAAGVDLGQFGLIAGALGVGIGFGLQGIVANFIAGIVMAFERPIQVGDTIQLGTTMGEVIHIGVRASTIKTFDGSEVIVPNSSLITNDVTNWTLSNRRRRYDVFVGVAYGTDPNKVLEIISKVANKHQQVQKTPAPWALFDGFGDSSLNFRVRFWTTFDAGLTVKSEITIGIYNALKEAGIEIPFPQRDIYIKSLPKEDEKAGPVKKAPRSSKEKET